MSTFDEPSMDRDVVSKSPLYGTSNYTNSREHQTHMFTLSRDDVQPAGLCHPSLQFCIARSRIRMYFSTCARILDTIPIQENRDRSWMAVSFHSTLYQRTPHKEMNNGPVVHRRRVTRAGRCWVQSGINYATEYVHMLNAFSVSCMLPLHSRPSIH